ncbi:MAG: hypothetical protein JSV86_10480 [Gemmatimonadota bacterium]|nr:MAG: hypothetical protein JSV86_10480 [Gemmatimonadota bacterium]
MAKYSTRAKESAYIDAHDAVMNISYFGGRTRCSDAFRKLVKAHKKIGRPRAVSDQTGLGKRMRIVDDVFIEVCVRGTGRGYS